MVAREWLDWPEMPCSASLRLLHHALLSHHI